MSGDGCAISRIAAEVEVTSTTTFRHRGLQRDACGLPMADLLGKFLYLYYFAGDRAPAEDLFAGGGPDGPLWVEEDAAFVRAIAAADRGKGFRSPGWTVVSASADNTAVVAMDGCLLTVPLPGAVPNTSVAVTFPGYRRYAQRGWYVIFGDAGSCPLAAGLVLRVYLAPRAPEEVSTLVSVLTGGLNEQGIRFHIKVRNHPASYHRSDAFMFYLRACDWAACRPVVEKAATTGLRCTTPDFTYPQAPGVGLAEEPSCGGLSFGQHRSRLVAEGLVSAADDAAVSAADRAKAVVARFRADGLDELRPYRHSPELDPVFVPWS